MFARSIDGQLPVPVASGTLERAPLSQLLAHVHANWLTGTLEIGAPDSPLLHLRVSLGHFAAIRTFGQSTFLGSLAKEFGMVNRFALDAAFAEAARTGRPLGAMLVANGVLDPASLRELLVSQRVRKLVSVAAETRDDTPFAFYEADLLDGYGGDDWPLSTPGAALWPVVCARPPLAQVHRLMERLRGRKWRLRPGAALDAAGFGESVGPILELLSKETPFEEIIAAVPSLASVVPVVIYCLWLLRSIDVDGVAQSDQPPASRDFVATPPASTTSLPPPSNRQGASTTPPAAILSSLPPSAHHTSAPPASVTRLSTTPSDKMLHAADIAAACRAKNPR